MKYFFVTLDTEEDNQWDTSIKKSTTLNSKYVPRFQKLCEEYGIKPVYFTTYGMASDKDFARFLYDCDKQGKCEVGMHLHAWDTPPYNDLDSATNFRPYITEYPRDVMEEKIETITKRLEDVFQRKILSHRAGRWATNQDYIELLYKCGYLIDSSYTPGVKWTNTLGATGQNGPDYSKVSTMPGFIYKELLEVPVSVRKFRALNKPNGLKLRDLGRCARDLIQGKDYWLRPSNNSQSIENMIKLADRILNESETDCLTFMIHTSELMPGCNPNFKTSEDIDFLYSILKQLFRYLAERTTSISLADYYAIKCNK